MPLLRDSNPEEEDESSLFDDVVRMADRLHLTGEHRSNYIDDHMTEAGFERIQTKDSYVKVQQQDDERGDTGRSRWFGGGRQQQQQGGAAPPARGRNPRQPQDNGDSF